MAGWIAAHGPPVASRRLYADLPGGYDPRMRVPVRRLLVLLALAAVPFAAPAHAAVNMTRIGHLDLDPGCGYSDALFVHDGRAYVMEYRRDAACANDQAWLHIIDVSDPTSPLDISETRLRDSYAADMHGVYYSNGFLYCGIQQPTQGVSIYDVRDPVTPVEVAFVPIPTGAHTLRVADHHLYVMSNFAAPRQIYVFDVSTPANPVALGGFAIPNPAGSPFCHDISIMENIGYASCWDSGLYLLDLTDPANITVRSVYRNPALIDIHSAWPSPDLRRVVTCQETDNQGARIFDVSGPTPVPFGQYNLGPGTIVHDVMIVGRYAYIAYYGSGVRILDIAFPANPMEVGSYATGAGCSGYCDSISEWVEDGVLYTVDMATGFYVFSFDLPHDTPITMKAVKSPNLTDVAFTWTNSGESQYTLRDGLTKQVPGTQLTDIDGRLSYAQAGIIPDGRLHYYKLNGPWR